MKRVYEVSKDTEEGVWTVTIPFPPEDAPYYTVLQAAAIVGTSPPSVYAAIRRGSLEGLMIGDNKYVTHKSVCEFLERREQRRELAEQKATRIKPVKIRRPPAPKRVDPSPTAQELLERGDLDFLDALIIDPPSNDPHSGSGGDGS